MLTTKDMTLTTRDKRLFRIACINPNRKLNFLKLASSIKRDSKNSPYFIKALQLIPDDSETYKTYYKTVMQTVNDKYIHHHWAVRSLAAVLRAFDEGEIAPLKLFLPDEKK